METETERNIWLKSFPNVDVCLLAAPVQQKTRRCFCAWRRDARML